MKKYISLEQAATRSSYSVGEWSEICRAGFLDCQLRGDQWFVSESDLSREVDLVAAVRRNHLASAVKQTHLRGRRLQQSLASLLLVFAILTASVVFFSAPGYQFKFLITQTVLEKLAKIDQDLVALAHLVREPIDQIKDQVKTPWPSLKYRLKNNLLDLIGIKNRDLP